MRERIVESWRHTEERWWRLLHTRPYVVAGNAAGIVTMVICALALVLWLPFCDEQALQAGLTIIAEIAGVLLGVMLVVVSSLAEQRQQAEELLLSASPTYERRMKRHAKEINSARRSLVQLLLSQQLHLSDPLFVSLTGSPSDQRYGGVLGSLSALTVALDSDVLGLAEKDLLSVGYTQDEMGKCLYGRGLTVSYDPVSFLQLVKESVGAICIVPDHFSGAVYGVAHQIWRSSLRDGLDGALSRYERARNVLGGRSLAASVAVLSLTTVGAVFAHFGATKPYVGATLHGGLVAAVVVGFGLSTLLTLGLMSKIL